MPKPIPISNFHRDRTMIVNPDTWPQWPALPLKRRDDNINGVPMCGILLDEGPLASPSGLSVYVANLFNLPKGRDVWDAVRYKTYANVDALLADGWEVD